LEVIENEFSEILRQTAAGTKKAGRPNTKPQSLTIPVASQRIPIREVFVEDVFNLELRKFLKRFGVTAQREIEQAVETALRERKLAGNEILPVHATLSIPGVLPALEINGEIALASLGPSGRS
jgi:Family of unknown function (DUF6494)